MRGHENVLKRLFVHAGAFNLGLWMRTVFGVGTPRSLQGRAVALGAMMTVLCTLIDDAITADTGWAIDATSTSPMDFWRSIS